MKQKPEGEQVEFLRRLLESCLKGVVEHEDDVRIETDVMYSRVVFSIFLNHSDVGLALGKDGVTIDAIRRIVWTACKKTSFNADLDVVTRGSLRRTDRDQPR